MILAAYGSGLYNVLFLGHMITFVVAFGPAVVSRGRQINFPALVVLGAFGLGLVVEGSWSFDETWVSLAFLVWLGLGGVVTGILMPSERKLAAGDASAERLIDRGGQLAVALLLVMLYLMIWKPGA